VATPFNFSATGGAAGPSNAAGGVGGLSLGFDNSGWTVSTGSSSASATNAKNDPTAAAVQAIPWTMIALVGGVVLLLVLRK
jgi:hypothetical protein